MWLCISGYGFVDFESHQAAEVAVQALQAQGIQAQMAKVRFHIHLFVSFNQTVMSWTRLSCLLGLDNSEVKIWSACSISGIRINSTQILEYFEEKHNYLSLQLWCQVWLLIRRLMLFSWTSSFFSLSVTIFFGKGNSNFTVIKLNMIEKKQYRSRPYIRPPLLHWKRGLIREVASVEGTNLLAW
jgi:hypothetical protein